MLPMLSMLSMLSHTRLVTSLAPRPESSHPLIIAQ
jgi:hypothetical protein